MSYSECSPDDSGLGGEGQQGEGADEEQGLDHGGGGGGEEEMMCWLQEGAGNTPRAPESGHIYRALAGAGAMPLLLQTSAQSTLQF